MGYQASQLRTTLEENSKKIQVLFNISWTVKDQISFVDRFKATNPENKASWPNPKEIHGEGFIK